MNASAEKGSTMSLSLERRHAQAFDLRSEHASDVGEQPRLLDRLARSLSQRSMPMRDD